jgi:hypothetical protein
MLIPKGTKVTSDGKLYFFEVEFDGIKFMLAEADQVLCFVQHFLPCILNQNGL